MQLSMVPSVCRTEIQQKVFFFFYHCLCIYSHCYIIHFLPY